jgi:hypothetical protein
MPNKCNIKNFSGYHSVENPTKKLLEQVSDVIRLKHYSYYFDIKERSHLTKNYDDVNCDRTTLR